MRAVEISAPGDPEVLRLCTRPRPDPARGEVLIRIAAAGVNRPDCLQRRGLYPPPPGASDIPGLEAAGSIAALADDVRDFAIGDRVCALLAGGGYAEYCAVPAVQCLPLPAGLDEIQAAALPETFFTVWTNVFQRGQLAAGECILIHGGASGIGTTAIQMASAFGARVYATCGSDEKRRFCERLGAERAINYREEEFAQVVRELRDGRGVNIILDMVGGSYFDDNIGLLEPDGRLVIIAVLGGSRDGDRLHAACAQSRRKGADRRRIKGAGLAEAGSRRAGARRAGDLSSGGCSTGPRTDGGEPDDGQAGADRRWPQLMTELYP
jgi:putative PIG3 family NAD(P)H quinone oxidoreductase